MKRKIATSVNVRINVGNFQHVEISKYVEEEIEFSSQEQRVELEDGLHNDVLSDLIRNMRVLPEKLGKTTNAVPIFEESVNKQVPDWMNSNIEPNIAKTSFNKRQAELKSEIIDEEKEIESLIGPEVEALDHGNVEKPVSGEEDLFESIIGNDSVTIQANDGKEKTVETKESDRKEEAANDVAEKNDLSDFDDDDLFD